MNCTAAARFLSMAFVSNLRQGAKARRQQMVHYHVSTRLCPLLGTVRQTTDCSYTHLHNSWPTLPFLVESQLLPHGETSQVYNRASSLVALSCSLLLSALKHSTTDDRCCLRRALQVPTGCRVFPIRFYQDLAEYFQQRCRRYVTSACGKPLTGEERAETCLYGAVRILPEAGETQNYLISGFQRVLKASWLYSASPVFLNSNSSFPSRGCIIEPDNAVGHAYDNMAANAPPSQNVDEGGEIVLNRFYDFLAKFTSSAEGTTDGTDGVQLYRDYLAQIAAMVENEKNTVYVDVQHVFAVSNKAERVAGGERGGDNGEEENGAREGRRVGAWAWTMAILPQEGTAHIAGEALLHRCNRLGLHVDKTLSCWEGVQDKTWRVQSRFHFGTYVASAETQSGAALPLRGVITVCMRPEPYYRHTHHTFVACSTHVLCATTGYNLPSTLRTNTWISMQGSIRIFTSRVVVQCCSRLTCASGVYTGLFAPPMP